MRVECGSCKKLTEPRFERVMSADGETGTVSIVCGNCGVAVSAPLGEKPPPATTIPLEKLCPKCGTVRVPDAEACRSCGLATEKMAAFADARDAVVPDELLDAWADLLKAWTEAPRHDALLLLVAKHSCYAWAAGRYRDRARARPHDTIAPKQLERLRRAGEATLFATATARPEKTQTPYAAVIAILALLIIAIGVGIVYALVRSNDVPPPPGNHVESR